MMLTLGGKAKGTVNKTKKSLALNRLNKKVCDKISKITVVGLLLQ